METMKENIKTNVYINDLGIFLPNKPVSNERIENVLGKVHNLTSRTRNIILKNNRIRERYYAIDPETGKLTHTNTQLCAQAIMNLKSWDSIRKEGIDILSCGTTSPDVITPNHALMVQGELKLPPCEAVATSGVCLTSMTALKYAYTGILSGQSDTAIVTASELSSSYMNSGFHDCSHPEDTDVDNNPYLAFNVDFLRWMLSDGAGSLYISSRRNDSGISLKIKWIDMLSYAGNYETCMYIGAVKNEDGSVKGWRECGSLLEAVKNDYFAVKQDVELVKREVMNVTITKGLRAIARKREMTPEMIDWFLPHYSSGYFRERVYDHMEKIDFRIPYEKWFTNLEYKGNVGSASIFIMLEELFFSGKLKKGQQVLCYIPESARFSVGYMLLEVV